MAEERVRTDARGKRFIRVVVPESGLNDAVNRLLLEGWDPKEIIEREDRKLLRIKREEVQEADVEDACNKLIAENWSVEVHEGTSGILLICSQHSEPFFEIWAWKEVTFPVVYVIHKDDPPPPPTPDFLPEDVQ